MGGRGVPAGTRPELAELVVWLRSGLDRVGHGRRWLAHYTGVSASTLQAAVAGRTVPSWRTTAAIAAVCGLDAETTSRLWRSARAERVGLGAVGEPEAAATAGEFARELSGLLLRAAGLTSARTIAAGAGLSKSKVNRVLKGDVTPPAAALEALLRPCALTSAEHHRWLAARARLAGEAALPVPDRPALTSVPPLPRTTRAALSTATDRTNTGALGDGAGEVVVLNPASPHLDAAVLADRVVKHLQKLRTGQGLHRVRLEIPQVLGEVCGVDQDAPAHTQREQLATAVAAAAADLPREVVRPALVALNLTSMPTVPGLTGLLGDGDGWSVRSTFTQRLALIAEAQYCDPRTARRRVDEAQCLLADVLVSQHFQRRHDMQRRDDAPHPRPTAAWPRS